MAHKSKSLPVLFVGLEEKDKVLFVQKYQSSKDIRDRIAEIIQYRLDAAIKSVEKEKLYEVPNWEYVQADNVGYRRALRECLTLLTFEYEVDHDR